MDLPTAQPTRLLLTNLPPSLTTPLLRAHLQRCPPFPPALTDLKILLKPDGTSRRIAFVGFKETTEADRVRKWVDGTWVQGSSGGSSVRVEWAKETADAPRSKKRVKLSSSLPPSLHPPSAGASKDDSEATRFAEFLSVMAPRRNRALEETSALLPTITSISAPFASTAAAPPVPTSAQTFVADLASVAEAVEKQAVPGDGVADDDSMTDMEYLARRTKRRLEEEPAADGVGVAAKGWVQDDAEAGVSTTLEAAPVVEAPSSAHQLILDSARLFVRNLAFSISEEELRSLFEPFGDIEQIHVPVDATSKKGKGLAYITFALASSAVQAFDALDQRSFQGRLLHILPAIARKSDAAGKDSRTPTLRGDRHETRKQEAGKGISWATLYMNSDAVLESVADRLSISKAELLDPSADNAAVRVALAESHVIAETKSFFEHEGVNLVALTSPGPRSTTSILVKNLPYNTTPASLTTLFSPFGPISRLLLPPSGTIAIVEMSDSASAADAWRGLVYKKVGGSVLYLEKAPAALFTGAAPRPSLPSGPAPPAPLDVASDLPSEAGSTLFVKNLAFSTSVASLTEAFAHFPSFAFARVQTKPDPKHASRTLSMGFGFVGFRTVAAAAEAKQAREGYLLEGHQLEIRFAQRGKDDSKAAPPRSSSGATSAATSSSTSTKLIVKNVPFEVTRKELRELFSAYGELKSVRLPRKIDHKTRGFAFLDFASRRDAEAAFAALEHTHLLGRHLVLQWAEQGEQEVEQLRARLGTFSKVAIGAQKGKFDMGGEKD